MRNVIQCSCAFDIKFRVVKNVAMIRIFFFFTF